MRHFLSLFKQDKEIIAKAKAINREIAKDLKELREIKKKTQSVRISAMEYLSTISL